MNGTGNTQNIDETLRTEQSDAGIDLNLRPGYRTCDNYLARAQVIYDRAKDAFFALKANDRALLAAAKRWERASVTLVRWAQTFFIKSGSTDEQRRSALEVIDRAAKDSAARSENISRYYDLLEQTGPEKTEELLEAENADLHHLDVLNRMLSTQSRCIKSLASGKGGMSREFEMEYEASKEIRDIYARIPEGHVYRPAFPYPPERIPEDEPVPDTPDPIKRAMNLPAEDSHYDTELNEFLPNEGYQSEDGLINDKSVVFHPESEEIEFGYADGPRHRWKYWKAKDDKDVPDPESWTVKYYRRWYDTYVREPDLKLLEPWPYECKYILDFES
ncbi:MAG: hypothetical protein IJI14_13775 [Anaerolineaceae bacterium]|nr:hypothetical protein [Anaerolineaceae bacterium]